MSGSGVKIDGRLYWHTRDGRLLRPSAMTQSHLENTIDMLICHAPKARVRLMLTECQWPRRDLCFDDAWSEPLWEIDSELSDKEWLESTSPIYLGLTAELARRAKLGLQSGRCHKELAQ